jgi:DNA sulfur modification protein DndC
MPLIRDDLSLIPSRSERDARLLGRIESTERALLHALDRGLDHWIVTFSGGKDSTSVAIIALEMALASQNAVRRIDLVYADTQMEIPTIQQFALKFLAAARTSKRLAPLNLVTHRVVPEMHERYWVLLLGRGYPPPHQRFRWCTRRLKIEPAERALRHVTQEGSSAILTGVRFGESKSRDRRLLSSCSRGGECGQGVWFQYSQRIGATYIAPIIDWEECDVWDYLDLVAPTLGYDTHDLVDLYNGADTRFGCWTCTVVSQEKALTRTVERPEWNHLRPLLEFRSRLWASTREATTRLQVDGRPGRLNLATRKRLLRELLGAQKAAGFQLIHRDEIAAIRLAWKSDPALRGMS